jgi:ABC-type antimicrobial peptide transport system permease subunit
MSPWQYIRDSLRQYRRIHVAVALGVAVTTAVVMGALLVGDSMRGSLRGLALKSLGRIDAMLLAEHPFREAMLTEWAAAEPLKAKQISIQPLILSQGSAVFRDEAGEVHRAAQLQVIGARGEFWSLAPAAGAPPIDDGNNVALTKTIADELGVEIGDSILLRLPLLKSLPAESTLGEKEETSASRRLKVAAVLSETDDASFARFSLRPSQQPPRNVFVPLKTIQDLLQLTGKANAATIANAISNDDDPAIDLAAIEAALHPELNDYGITVNQIELGQSDRAYIHISADRLVIPPHLEEVARDLYGDAGLEPVVTYLANRIAAGNERIPYSTVAGVDSTAALGPVLDDAGHPIQLADDEVALNDWAADRLQAKVGDSITMTWYEPETTHGELHEAPPLTLKVRAIVPLADSKGQPTWAADPHFAPELPGVTDKATIEQWKLPFELVEPIGNDDDEYWEQYRTTPKAFVSHALAAKLWTTRWGTDSVLRIPKRAGASPPPAPLTTAAVKTALRQKLDPASMGLRLTAVKQQALDAAAGTTPFDGLFLGFSFFLMASAIMLTALLFRLGIEQRAREVGLLAALGLPPRTMGRLLLGESAIVAALGALVGLAAGVGYAALMVHGLNTWWLAATVASFMELHVTPRSLTIGFGTGLIVALATMAWSLRRFARLPARQLLAGDAQPALAPRSAGRWTTRVLPIACIFASLALGLASRTLEGESKSGAFMAAGALVLLGMLAAIRGKLREPVIHRPTRLALSGLAARNARRNPSRTMLSLALAATASFLIVALSSFRLEPTDRGVGGFDLIATADLPLLYDLSTPEGRRQLGFNDEAEAKLKDADIVGFRVHEGQDASCLNLFEPTQPRILGAPPSLAAKSRFAFAAEAPQQNQIDPAPSPWWRGLGRGADAGISAGSPHHSAKREQQNWSLLNSNLGRDERNRPIIPTVLDQSTAAYSLKKGLGDTLILNDGRNQPVTFRIVALLSNSVLQGSLIISEGNFLKLFPETAGQRFFLIRRGPQSQPTSEFAALLETQLDDFGFDAVVARRRLSELLAVQNTYLSAFQSLGALGLLLGVVGLAVAQLRSVLERRGELALMQATGFRRRRLAWMVLAENLVLLIGGLGIGCLAALVAVLPQSLTEQASAPWLTLTILLGVVLAAGAAAAWLASRAVLRAPLLPALRGE